MKEIFVFISIGKENIPVGSLWFHARKGKESTSFEYDKFWLSHPKRFSLEPLLKLTRGTFHTQDKNIFGSIGDSAPDRWGRALILRARAREAQKKKEKMKTLFEYDYLLGVNDIARQGALRFSIAPHKNVFLDSSKFSIPPFLYLSKLLSASENFFEEKESEEELKLLLAPGSSLGGARPKASILDKDRHLALAKFPRKDDAFNMVLWEAVALSLAKKAKLKTPVWNLQKVLKKPVLILKRFDRKVNIRIPFLSALSFLGAKDHEQHSYQELAYLLLQNGGSPKEDLKELWRLLVFNLMISNTDNHLRNHGFLYEYEKGWRLSPAYDLNPTPLEIKPRFLSTSIARKNPLVSLELALSIKEDFRLSEKKALSIIKEVSEAVKEWRKTASFFGISKKEIDRMSSAFEHEDLKTALS